MVSPSSREPDGTAGRKPPTHPFQIGAFRAYLMVRLSTILASNGMALIIAWEAYNIARQTMSPGSPRRSWGSSASSNSSWSLC
ncbi:hypothetical protein M2337_003040 [Sphingobium sp. B2D3A]|nr:hypothetical protein [Sphingobium sp. B2D3A]